MDCLTILRKFVKNKEKFAYVDINNSPVERLQDAEEFVFGTEARFPKDTLTTYPNKQAKGFYSLAAVLLLLEYQQKDYSSYLKNSVAAGIVSVSFLDKKPLLDYLEGVTDNLPQAKIDSNPTQTNASPEAVVSDLPGDLGPQPTKRRYEVDPKVVKALELEMPKKSKYHTLIEAKVDFTAGLDEMIHCKLIDPQATQPDDFLKKKGPPVIIVPLNTTATITKYNVKDFVLGHGHKSTLELLTKNAVKPEKLIFERTEILDDHKQSLYTIPDGLPAEVEVIDSVNDLKLDDWDRVVGVFCVGKEWQFKGFKWENSNDLFNNVPGVYVMDQSEPSFDPSLAKDWKVGKFDISSSTPLTYSRFLESFWKSIDSHIKEKKPWYVNSTPYWS